MPLLVFLAGFYLCFAKEHVTLRGVYYGAFDASRDGKTPVFDLGLFEELVKWTSASLALDRFGSAEAAGELLARAQDLVRRRGRGEPVYLKKVGRQLQSVSRAIMAGRTQEVLSQASRLQALVSRPSTGAGLSEEVAAWAPPFVTLLERTLHAFTALVPQPGERFWRGCLRLANWYWEHGHIHLAVQLLREVAVTAVVEVNRGASTVLEPATRSWAERWLNAEAVRGTPAGRIWAEIRDCRNDLAHMGFRPDPKPVGTVVAVLGRQFKAISQLPDAAWAAGGGPSAPAGGGKMLLTPLGLSPGELYTAVLRVQPDRTVVVTSTQGAELAQEAMARAGAGGTLTVLTVQDPYGGFREAEEVISRVLQQVAQQPVGEAWVNLAGGTTALQHIVTRAGERLRELVPLVRTVAVADGRPREEQRARPYVLGDLIELA